LRTPLYLRLIGWVVATVLLPLVAVAALVPMVVDTPDERLLLRVGLCLAVIASVVAYASLFVAYRAVARASEAMTARARGVAVGHLGADPLPVSGPRELARLGRAFNDMLTTVRAYVEERDRTQGEFRHSVQRLGAALSGSHDVDAISEVTVETARLVTRCRTALLWVVEDDKLMPREIDGEGRVRGALAIGEGLAGVAAATATPRSGDERAPGEPHHEHGMAAPLLVRDKVWGVLAVYGRVQDTSPYSLDDVVTLTTLARQAETAIENVDLHAEATRLALTDPLTGLANRRELERRMALEIERADRFGEPFSLALLDLDDFKLVNDTYGHPAGDAVLVEVARRLRGITREVDLVARSGGEELAVLLPRADGATAARAAMRIRRVIAARPVQVGAEAIRVTCSVGLASHPDHGSTAYALVAAADEALYRAKAAGKNRVELAERA
jgi:two-component system cell cycle response regulator